VPPLDAKLFEMNSTAPQPNRWTRQRWWCVIALLFGAELSLVFFASEKTAAPNSPPSSPTKISLLLDVPASREILSSLGASDPTLFALSGAKSFSGAGWLNVPPREHRLQEWTEPDTPLRQAGGGSGAQLAGFLSTNSTGRDLVGERTAPEMRTLARPMLALPLLTTNLAPPEAARPQVFRPTPTPAWSALDWKAPHASLPPDSSRAGIAWKELVGTPPAPEPSATKSPASHIQAPLPNPTPPSRTNTLPESKNSRPSPVTRTANIAWAHTNWIETPAALAQTRFLANAGRVALAPAPSESSTSLRSSPSQPMLPKVSSGPRPPHPASSNPPRGQRSSFTNAIATPTWSQPETPATEATIKHAALFPGTLFASLLGAFNSPAATARERPAPPLGVLPRIERDRTEEASVLVLSGAITERRPLSPVLLPTWPHHDVLRPTAIEIAANSSGEVLFTRLAASSGLRRADEHALGIARALRFEPIAGKSSAGAVEKSSATTGIAKFIWQQSPADTAAPAPRPP
jgi:hypothetical protein